MNRIKATGYNKTTEQHRASEPDRNVWVSASAGSGKTSVLVDRLLKLLLTGTSPSSVLCLTFTKATAAEMSTRLINELARWVNADDSELTQILRDLNCTDSSSTGLDIARCMFAKVLETPEGLRIQTIHSFCETLLRRFPIEAGISPHFSVLDENEARNLLLGARDNVFCSVDLNSTLAQALDELVTSINETQFEQLLNELLSHRSRIEHTWKAKGGLDSTIAATYNYLGLSQRETIGKTVASACVEGEFDAKVLLGVAEELLKGSKTDAARGLVIKNWLEGTLSERSLRWDQYVSVYLTKKSSEVRGRLVTKKTLERIPWATKTLNEEAERVSRVAERCRRIHTAQSTSAMLTVYDSIYNEYQRAKAAINKLDYFDLITFARNLLKQPDIGSWVLFKLDGGIDHILVDEAQDTSPDQWEVIAALTTEFFSGHGSREIQRTLFVVGDEKQSIYSFQGADPQVFHNIRHDFQRRAQNAEKRWEELPLSRSFRAAPILLRFIDCLFQNNDNNSEHTPQIWCHHQPQRLGDGGLVELWPVNVTQHTQRESWELPLKQHHAVTSEAKLAKRIARRIHDWLETKEILESTNKPIDAGDIMILVRQRKRLFEEIVLALKRHGIPVTGSDRMVLIEQLAVQDLIAVGQFVLLPEDDLMLANVLKGPFIGFDDETLFHLAWDRGKLNLWECLLSRTSESPEFSLATSLLNKFLSKSRQTTPFSFFSDILTEGGRASLIARLGEEANDPIDEFLNLAIEFEGSRAPSLQGFLSWLDVNSGEIKRDLEQAAGRVRVMTVHGAKGLEAPVVFLPDTTTPPRRDRMFHWTEADDSGLLLWPAAKKEKYDDITATALEQDKVKRAQEYERLLYVALTRARDRLYICGATGRNQIPKDSWYSFAENSMDALGSAVQNVNTVIGDEHIEIRRLFEQQDSKIQDDRGGSEVLHAAALPGWLRTKPEMALESSEIIFPSRLDAISTIPKVPFAETTTRLDRGNNIHRLLHVLPKIPADRRKRAARSLLCRQRLRPEAALIDELIEEAVRTIEDPRFSIFFGPGSIAEAPIVTTINNKKYSGQIDRLVILDNEVLIADYKTDRSASGNYDRIEEKYKYQMAVYRQAMLQVYPSHQIKCFLLWTSIPMLMEIPSGLLDESIFSNI